MFSFVKNNDLDGIKIAFYGGIKNLEEYVDQENRNIAHLVLNKFRRNIFF